MPLSLGHSPWLLALCALVAAGLTVWTYRRTTPPLPAGWKALLGGLRFAALALILFLLFEPIWRRVQTDEQPPVLAVLLDDSQSLRLTAAAGDGSENDEPSPGDAADSTAARPAIADALRGLRTTPGGSTLRFFAFGPSVRALPDGDAALLDSLRFDGGRTDVAAALETARAQARGDNLRGIVLVSDGQYNAGRNPLYVAERSPVPIHTVVVGDTARQRDLQVRRVTTNEIAYVDAALPVQAGLRADGYGGQRVQVVLAKDGERLDAQRVTLPEGRGEVPVDLTFLPEEPGLQRLTVGVSRLDGEATYRNNTQTVAVRVLESKRRVLLLGAAPTPDVAAARQLLEGDDRIEVTARVSKSAGTFYDGPLPDSLAGFDAAVLAGFPGSAAAPEDVRRLAAAAADGLPLFFLLTRQTDLGAVRRALGDVLPTAPEEIRDGFTEAAFAPTPRSQQHPIFDLPPEAAGGAWAQLPPLLKSQSRWQASPDAQVLATATVRGVALDDPLLVTRRRSGQRTAALLAAGTWRWSNLPEDLSDAAAGWPALFANTVQWISAREDDRPVRVQPTQQTFAGGEPVVFNGQVYDESLQPVPDASLQLELTGPDGNRFPYQMEAVGSGRYVARLGALPEGAYRYTATAERGGAELGSDRGRFAVGGLTLEYRETRADAALMRQIAERSGGTFRTLSDAAALPAQLTSAGAFTPLVQERAQEQPLWHVYYFLAAIIVLLGAEWFLRKRRGMV